MGSAAEEAVDALAIRLHPNVENNDDVREYIAYALGEIQNKSKPQITTSSLVNALQSDPSIRVRSASAHSLGELAIDGEQVLPELVKALKDSKGDSAFYGEVSQSIGKFGIQGEPYLNELIQIVESSKYDTTTKISIAGSMQAISEAIADKSVIKSENWREILQSYRQLSSASNKLGEVLKALEDPELKNTNEYEEVQDQKELIDGRQRELALLVTRQWFNSSGRVVAIHGLIWLALIFAYPRSPMVQTAFFWNPRIRRILGFPYVTGALKWVPFFRNILFIPFRDALRSDANLDLFKGQAYFADLTVKAEGWSESQPINQVIPKLSGQIVLQGESGSGKSMFLRYLLSRSSRIAVYLPAQKCSQGVIAAIQAKLYGQAQDADFLRDLIYSGAIDIYIDGLNEVTPDTRASIKDFVEKNFKGNIILTTQPLEWQPPGQVYHLCPLGMDQIKTFLRQHQPAGSTSYADACDVYLAKVQADLGAETVPADEKAALQQSLANPMDLTVVAQLLASQKQPDLLRLREQQYFTMAEDYQRIYLGRSFPLGVFAELAYRLRLESQVQIPSANFDDELLCLERHKMVVRRQRSGEGGNGLTQWFFRHEKMADFFVAQSFLQATDDRQTQHFADSRFRGVYLLLASLLPEAQKMALREQLIQYAVRNNDHVLSDAFIRLVGSPSFLQP